MKEGEVVGESSAGELDVCANSVADRESKRVRTGDEVTSG